jgi:hypothetical protein
MILQPFRCDPYRSAFHFSNISMVSFLDEKILPCSLSDAASPRKGEHKKNRNAGINTPKQALKVDRLDTKDSNAAFYILKRDFLFDCKLHPSYRRN